MHKMQRRFCVYLQRTHLEDGLHIKLHKKRAGVMVISPVYGEIWDTLYCNQLSTQRFPILCQFFLNTLVKFNFIYIHSLWKKSHLLWREWLANKILWLLFHALLLVLPSIMVKGHDKVNNIHIYITMTYKNTYAFKMYI